MLDLARASLVAVVVATAACAEPPCPHERTAGWTPLASMRQARFEHALTRLATGELLVTGGFDGEAMLASAELYDPAADAWRDAGAMAAARGGHTATLLPDGRVLVVGGAVAGAPSAEVYDPATDTFARVGELVTPRGRHTATPMPDGGVIVIGGFAAEDDVTDRVERFDPATGAFADAGRLAERRAYHFAARLSSGDILVATGEHAINIATAERFDPASGGSTVVGDLATPHAFCGAAVLLAGDRLLVTGGEGVDPPDPGRDNPAPHVASVEIYDPVTATWTTAAPMASIRCGHTATLLADGRVLVAGGHVGPAGREPLATAEVFDPETGTWSDAGRIGACRHAHRAARLDDGRVVLVGGVVDGHVTATVDAFAP